MQSNPERTTGWLSWESYVSKLSYVCMYAVASVQMEKTQTDQNNRPTVATSIITTRCLPMRRYTCTRMSIPIPMHADAITIIPVCYYCKTVDARLPKPVCHSECQRQCQCQTQSGIRNAILCIVWPDASMPVTSCYCICTGSSCVCVQLPISLARVRNNPEIYNSLNVQEVFLEFLQKNTNIFRYTSKNIASPVVLQRRVNWKKYYKYWRKRDSFELYFFVAFRKTMAEFIYMFYLSTNIRCRIVLSSLQSLYA